MKDEKKTTTGEEKLLKTFEEKPPFKTFQRLVQQKDWIEADVSGNERIITPAGTAWCMTKDICPSLISVTNSFHQVYLSNPDKASDFRTNDIDLDGFIDFMARSVCRYAVPSMICSDWALDEKLVPVYQATKKLKDIVDQDPDMKEKTVNLVKDLLMVGFEDLSVHTS